MYICLEKYIHEIHAKKYRTSLTVTINAMFDFTLTLPRKNTLFYSVLFHLAKNQWQARLCFNSIIITGTTTSVHVSADLRYVVLRMQT